MRDWLRRFRRMSDEEFAAEVQAHLEHDADEQVEQGLPHHEARFAALRRFGNVTRHLERFREASPWFWIETLWQDVRYGWRSLWRTPLLTTVAVVSLAAGIGANSAIYTVARAVLLEPLRLPEPDRVFFIHDENSDMSWMPLPYQEQIARLAMPFGTAGPWIQWPWPVGFGDTLKSEWVLYASEGATSALGFEPRLGRWPSAMEQRSGAPVAVLTDRLWRQYGAHPEILGRRLRLSTATFTVIGVAPPLFRGLGVGLPYGVIAPLRSLELLEPGILSGMPAAMLGRLAPGHSLAAAAQEVASWRLEPVAGAAQAPRLRLQTPRQWMVPPDSERRLTRILGGVAVIAGLVLLLGCSNLASTMLARTELRRREMAMRISLGATRMRLVRLLFVEFALLSLTSTAVAVVLSRWMLQLLPAATLLGYNELDTPVVLPLEFSAAIAGFTAAVGVICCAIFGGIPALRSTSIEPGAALRVGGDGRSTGRGLWRHVLLGLQVSVTCVLLVAVLLLNKTLDRATTLGLGLDTRDNLVFTLVTFDSVRHDPHRVAQSRTAIVDRLARDPAYVSSAFTLGFEPFRPPRVGDRVTIDGAEHVPSSYELFRGDMAGGRVYAEWIDPTYRATVGLPLLRGRDLAPNDANEGEPAVLVNHALAGQFWPGGQAVGARVRLHVPLPLGWDESENEGLPGYVAFGWIPRHGTARIVGVIGDARFDVKAGTAPCIYFASGAAASQVPIFGGLYVRMRGLPAHAVAATRAAVHAVAPDEPLPGVVSRSDYVASQLSAERTALGMLVWFSVGAMALGVLGVYGIAAHVVTRRSRELAIRMALGSAPAAVSGLVIKSGLVPVLSGLFLGCLAAAVCEAVLLRPVIVGVEPFNPAVYVTTCVLLGAVAVGALYRPAWRAGRIDLAVTLRSE